MAYKDGGKSGGRKPGSKNKLTLALAKVREEAVAKLNQDLGPDAFKGDAIEFLQHVYKSPHFDFQTRMEAATRVSQFERAKKTETMIDDNVRYVVRMPDPVATVEEWLAREDACNKNISQDAEWEQRIAKIEHEATAKKDQLQ
jgi:hypothetical protein